MNEELQVLKDRVITGNEKLYRAWEQMKGLEPGGEAWKQASEQYDKALSFLEALCIELKAKGFRDCLYKNEFGKKTKHCLVNPDQPAWFCRVCPSQHSYWEEELMSLPSPK